jgi:flagellar motor switch protein FliM
MSLCIPYNVIEPIMGILSAQTWVSYQRKGSQEDTTRRLTRSVSSAPIEMRAILAKTTIRMSDLLSLGVGDLITTDKGAGGEVTILAEERVKFRGRIGQFRGTRAVQITRVVAEPEEPPAGGSGK